MTSTLANDWDNITHTLWCSPWMPKCNVISNGELSGGCRWNSQRWMVYSMRGHKNKPKIVELITNIPIVKLSKKKKQINTFITQHILCI